MKCFIINWTPTLLAFIFFPSEANPIMDYLSFKSSKSYLPSLFQPEFWCQEDLVLLPNVLLLGTGESFFKSFKFSIPTSQNVDGRIPNVFELPLAPKVVDRKSKKSWNFLSCRMSVKPSMVLSTHSRTSSMTSRMQMKSLHSAKTRKKPKTIRDQRNTIIGVIFTLTQGGFISRPIWYCNWSSSARRH